MDIYPITYLEHIYKKSEKITNNIVHYNSNEFSIKLEYIDNDGLFFEDYYIQHSFIFFFVIEKKYICKSTHIISECDGIEKKLIKNNCYDYEFDTIPSIIYNTNNYNEEFIINIHKEYMQYYNDNIIDNFNKIKI
jgi:hypothetical protein